MARLRISIPAAIRRKRHFPPLDAIFATPLIFAFELLLCNYLESKAEYNKPFLKLSYVFLPLEIWQVIVIVENFRKCYDMFQVPEHYLVPDAFWLLLHHFADGFYDVCAGCYFNSCGRLDKVLCRICYAEEISMVLLPCLHHVLCQFCAMKCERCPFCRQIIESRILVNDTSNEAGTG